MYSSAKNNLNILNNQINLKIYFRESNQYLKINKTSLIKLDQSLSRIS